jgi:hypothetical protein
MTFQLSNPGRTIEAGMILMGETEILDVAPIDLLHGISTKFVNAYPLPEELKAKALDINFHWVTETGAAAKLTSNITMEATASSSAFRTFFLQRTVLMDLLGLFRNLPAIRHRTDRCLLSWIYSY